MHWRNLINFESILFLSGLIVRLSKTVKYPICPSKWRVELIVKEVVFFPAPEEIVYSFFNFPWMIFWNGINLAYVSQLGNEYLVSDYIFTSQRESHFVPDMVFFANLQLFCPIWIYRE